MSNNASTYIWRIKDRKQIWQGMTINPELKWALLERCRSCCEVMDTKAKPFFFEMKFRNFNEADSWFRQFNGYLHLSNKKLNFYMLKENGR